MAGGWLQLEEHHCAVAVEHRRHVPDSDLLVLTAPDVIRQIHDDYLAAGADLIETNTFGAMPLVLAEYDIQDRAEEINERAAELETL